MSIPSPSEPVPARVRDLAGDARLEPVWRNNIGGLTFRATGADGIRYLKWGPLDAETSMRAEAERLRWASAFTRVPRVLDEGRDATHEWLVTAAVPGRSAVDPRWIAEPATAVRAVGRGLRALHEALPVDRPVVCHGDACAPNTLVDDAGKWTAHVDLGALGVADRWADLAAATMSTGWNYGPGWEEPLLDAYGVAPDAERLAFYRDLWNTT
jgi:kanamycin kinase